ncbi:thiamine pyrophosphate-binding protein [Sporomusa acidovorans]|uniref:Acetolactate synthase large subunit n=1 Tax=Sporomusa acidovorans (strain ATCC 49682 / DSM 3132 / Mol) TaxID=1123286 RepID=A0ABZ3J709_SPOA4|nr:thiamine pyrophosphate-binding protein [Sporomusa acidovorans]OZC23489.1 acetolactate synthase large subunit [Sporomusa acidovorans DSM 3132]SDF28382.1 acetolactate synthase-1/2/3 large subunit [Sporomusa acidovorans]
MVRIADFIANFVFQQGVEYVFMVSGGGMMFLSDGLAQHPDVKIVANHHEQACAMGAVAYSKYREDLAVAYLTTGCGSTNAITGLLDAWQDSVPVLFISGQTKRKETVANSGLKLRQFGVQEVNIIPVVTSLTKYAVMVNEPQDIAYHLEKAVYLAKSGRPGPVWLDIPLDVQAAIIDESNLRHFSKQEMLDKYNKLEPTDEELKLFAKLLEKAQRPIFVVGQGVRISKAIPIFRSFVEKNNIPVVASRLGIDVLPSDHPLFIGRIGTKGDRAGNFALQNADFVIAIGSRLSVCSTGHEYSLFARQAKLVVVDIDPEEHKKNTVKIDSFINADAYSFLVQITSYKSNCTSDWVNRCQKWKEQFKIKFPNDSNKRVNLYNFMEVLNRYLKEDGVVVSDAGSANFVVSQSISVKENARFITSAAQADMGFTLPAAIGTSFAKNKESVIGITGDGSFQMNIQELQTIIHHSLPIKLFVWNNDGYLSIRNTQKNFFDGRLIGTDGTNGVSFPDLRKIAHAYGFKYFKISNENSLEKIISRVMKYPEAVICEVMCLENQDILTVSSLRIADGSFISRPLEDMSPLLERTKLKDSMIVEPILEDN